MEKFENATITGHLGFVFEENWVRKITWLSWRHHFEKLCFQNVFRQHENEKSTFSNSSGLRSVFKNTLFSGRISVDGKHCGRNKAALISKLNVLRLNRCFEFLSNKLFSVLRLCTLKKLTLCKAKVVFFIWLNKVFLA